MRSKLYSRGSLKRLKEDVVVRCGGRDVPTRAVVLDYDGLTTTVNGALGVVSGDAWTVVIDRSEWPTSAAPKFGDTVKLVEYGGTVVNVQTAVVGRDTFALTCTGAEMVATE